MEKPFNKIKTWVATLGLAVVSFFSKVFGQSLIGDKSGFGNADNDILGEEVQALYAAPYVPKTYVSDTIGQSTLMDTIFKIAKRPLIGITLIIGIISLIKIRKIEDKAQKKKKIKRIIIIISILVVLIVASLILPLLLKK